MEEKKQEVADEELTKDDEKQGFLVDNFDEVFNEFFPFADTD